MTATRSQQMRTLAGSFFSRKGSLSLVWCSFSDDFDASNSKLHRRRSELSDGLLARKAVSPPLNGLRP